MLAVFLFSLRVDVRRSTWCESNWKGLTEHTSIFYLQTKSKTNFNYLIKNAHDHDLSLHFNVHILL